MLNGLLHSKSFRKLESLNMESRESVFIVNQHSQEDLRLQRSPMRERKHSSGLDSDNGNLSSPAEPKRRRIINELDTPNRRQILNEPDTPNRRQILNEPNTPSSTRRIVKEPETPNNIRQIMNELDTPSSQVSSCSDSPTLYDCLDDSCLSSPGASPAQTLMEKFKKRYKKDELWSAIKTNYQYIMDNDIINTCNTTESDHSLDDEDYDTNSSISFTEFVQQYRELSDWLCKLQKATSCKTMGLTISEKCLYQSWHNEILKTSPQLELFNQYAVQLEERYPSLTSEIKGRLQYLNGQWHEVEKGINSRNISQDPVTMLKDLEADLSCLRNWLDKVEDELLSLNIDPLWSMEKVEQRLLSHKELQSDIESHSRVVSAILKLGEQLRNDAVSDRQKSPNVAAVALQKRWHSVWLQSLEWQCRLEDVINKKKTQHEASPFAVKADSFLDSSANSVEDSFTFESGFRGDIAFSPGISDSSTTYSPDVDKLSGKDSACASEAELKLSDMSGHIDLSLSTSSDSDLDMRQRIDVGLHSKDIGYGSESHSNDETEMKKFRNLTFNSVGSVNEKQDLKYNIYRMTIDIESTEKTDGDEVEITDGINGYGQSLSIDKNTSVVVLGSDYVSTEENAILDYDHSPKEDIKFLIDQVDSVYRESSPFHSHEGKMKSKQQKHEHVGVSSGNDSSRPFMVDANVGTTSVVESSCDASGEDTSDSERDEEFSTASDDGADTLFDSVVCLAYTSDSKNTSPSTNFSPLFDTSRLRKHGRHGRTKRRPWSVVELQEMNKGIDLQILALSESAINRLTGNGSDSEIKHKSQHFPYHSSTFPRERTKKHSFQLTFSASEQSSSSPVYSKRKLEYISNSSGHTNTASGSCHTVPLTSDDNTNICSKTEKLLQNAEMKTSSSSYDGDSESPHGSTTDEYMTPPMVTVNSDPDDLMNSGASLSETAWDNYQAPLYPTVSEDPSEEPLQWDPVDELEFDEEITLGHKSILADVIQRSKSPGKKIKRTSFTKDAYDDSNSDNEDLFCLIYESTMSLKVADRSLRKKRKDPLGTGLNFNPNQYGEILATCDTNIDCLKKIQHHLGAGNATDDEIQQLSELLYEWEKIQALATERWTQSQELEKMFAALLAIQDIVQNKQPELLINVFQSPEELSSTVKSLQTHCSSLETARTQLKTLEEEVVTFASENSVISMFTFLQQLQWSKVCVEEECERVGCHLLELERTQKQYLEYLSAKQEVDCLLNTKRDLLQRLAFRKKITRSANDADYNRDIKCLVKDMLLFQEKLTQLEDIHCHQLTVFTGPTRVQMKAGLADIHNQLLVIKHLCKELLKSGVIVSEKEDTTVVQSLDVDIFSKVEKTIGQKIGALTTWLQSRPMQTSVICVLLALLYWVNPGIINKIADFSVHLAPDFRYIDGPPSV